MPLSLSLHQGDITKQVADVIVNAANSGLRGGGGVDGAIHRAAGPGLFKECIPLGPCATGDFRVTGAHGLNAKWVIHAVGPVWQGGARGEDDALASCYLRSLHEALERGAKSIAFPAISTGVYAFPLDRAVGVVARAFSEFERLHPEADLDVRLVLFGDEAYTAFSKRYATPGALS